MPSAHTCTNTVEMPNYFASLRATAPTGTSEEQLRGSCRELLDAKLRFAVLGSQGYGLDEFR